MIVVVADVRNGCHRRRPSEPTVPRREPRRPVRRAGAARPAATVWLGTTSGNTRPLDPTKVGLPEPRRPITQISRPEAVDERRHPRRVRRTAPRTTRRARCGSGSVHPGRPAGTCGRPTDGVRTRSRRTRRAASVSAAIRPAGPPPTIVAVERFDHAAQPSRDQPVRSAVRGPLATGRRARRPTRRARTNR